MVYGICIMYIVYWGVCIANLAGVYAICYMRTRQAAGRGPCRCPMLLYSTIHYYTLQYTTIHYYVAICLPVGLLEEVLVAVPCDVALVQSQVGGGAIRQTECICVV
jgi:hypothetical protein